MLVLIHFQNKFEFQIQNYTIIVTLIMIAFIIIEHQKQIYVSVRLSLWYYNIIVHLAFLISIANQKASKLLYSLRVGAP